MTLDPATWLISTKSTKYPETPLNSARRADIWLPRGCPDGAKNMTHTLAGEAAPVYDHARDWIQTTQWFALCNSCHYTRGRLQSVQVVRGNDNTSRTFLDNEMEQKCDVPAGIHDAGTKFWEWWPCGSQHEVGTLVTAVRANHVGQLKINIS